MKDFKFRVINSNGKLPSTDKNAIYLEANDWDDFGYKTQFYLSLFDSTGSYHEIGSIKIAKVDQKDDWTLTILKKEFPFLEPGIYSVGQERQYYENLMKLNDELKDFILTSLNDLALDPSLLASVSEQDIFKSSISRGFGSKIIRTQFQRILAGDVPLTPYHFTYRKKLSDEHPLLNFDFKVVPDSHPTSNIHVLIGGNGVGKTTILNSMVTDSTVFPQDSNYEEGFYDNTDIFGNQKISEEYFLNIISVSFSAFDPFILPKIDKDEVGPNFTYIGLRAHSSEKDSLSLKGINLLWSEFSTSTAKCCRLKSKVKLWKKAMDILSTDPNLATLGLSELVNVKTESEIKSQAYELISKTSSGHTIVLLTIARLIEAVEEKTLVLIDEPETHLHPPLLSAYIKSLSMILNSQNGVAILATHSPVVIQNIPSSCVTKMFRHNTAPKVEILPLETYGENLGLITREVFNLEVHKSGFYNDLDQITAIEHTKTYDEIVKLFKGQIGYEGKALLRALVLDRPSINEGK